ncbi:MAG TPA: ABC transporter substrate binding protein [Dehalococcoidia bacterium]|nr:ABC transporter substrate binding protein [Dehalococcoidia bacterium]
MTEQEDTSKTAKTGGVLKLARCQPDGLQAAVGLGLTDPVAAGLAASQGRPTSNVTGVLDAPLTLGIEKLRELLKEAVPGLLEIGVIWDPASFGGPYETTGLPFARPAAAALGLNLRGMNVHSDLELDAAFSAARADGVPGSTDTRMYSRRRQPHAGLRIGLEESARTRLRLA